MMGRANHQSAACRYCRLKYLSWAAAPSHLKADRQACVICLCVCVCAGGGSGLQSCRVDDILDMVPIQKENKRKQMWETTVEGV